VLTSAAAPGATLSWRWQSLCRQVVLVLHSLVWIEAGSRELMRNIC
jgi:hypothetical protein